jgi:hypothetical protein
VSLFSWFLAAERLLRWRFDMSLFSSVTKWFVQSGIADKAKQAAVHELTDAAAQFVQKVQSHAPDLADHVENKITDALAAAVAGALTRK